MGFCFDHEEILVLDFAVGGMGHLDIVADDSLSLSGLRFVLFVRIRFVFGAWY